MNIPLLQSPAWQTLQHDLHKTTFFEQTADFQYLAILETTPLGNYLFTPYGPVASSKKGFSKALQSLTELAKVQHAVFIRIEPQNPAYAKFLPTNAQKSKDINPSRTWALDLTGSDADLKAKLPSRLYRYYKNAAQNGLTVTTSKAPADIKYLLDLQQKLAKTKNISTFSADYLKTQLKQPFATLYLVKYDQKVIAAGLVFDDATTRYNLQGAQDNAYLKLHATGILTIQLILDAKAKNLQTFDFWGIAPDDTPKNHPWAGFTAFKKTFAGTAAQYAGTYDIILNRSRYTLYQILRRLNLIIRKLK